MLQDLAGSRRGGALGLGFTFQVLWIATMCSAGRLCSSHICEQNRAQHRRRKQKETRQGHNQDPYDFMQRPVSSKHPSMRFFATPEEFQTYCMGPPKKQTVLMNSTGNTSFCEPCAPNPHYTRCLFLSDSSLILSGTWKPAAFRILRT